MVYRRRTLIEKYKHFFKKINPIFEKCFDVELIMVACCLFRPRPLYEEAWSIVGGNINWSDHEQPLAARRAAKYIHYMYCDTYSQEMVWQQALDIYSQVPAEYRLFPFDAKEKKWGPPTPPIKDEYQSEHLDRVLLHLNECAEKSDLSFFLHVS